jgi:hypothetical protein
MLAKEDLSTDDVKKTKKSTDSDSEKKAAKNAEQVAEDLRRKERKLVGLDR